MLNCYHLQCLREDVKGHFLSHDLLKMTPTFFYANGGKHIQFMNLYMEHGMEWPVIRSPILDLSLFPALMDERFQENMHGEREVFQMDYFSQIRAGAECTA